MNKVLLVLMLFGLAGCSRVENEFLLLKRYHKDDPVTRSRVQWLKEQEQGVLLALQDINCFGGETGGYSAWILRNSTLKHVVEPKLKNLAVDSSAKQSKRIEAVKILLERTGRSEFLQMLFRFARRGGEPSVDCARRALARFFYDYPEYSFDFSPNYNIDLNISESDFDKAVYFIENNRRASDGEPNTHGNH